MVEPALGWRELGSGKDSPGNVSAFDRTPIHLFVSQVDVCYCTARTCGGNGVQKTINGVSALVSQGAGVAMPGPVSGPRLSSVRAHRWALSSQGTGEATAAEPGTGVRARSRLCWVSMRLPRRRLVLGLRCRPRLARWSRLPLTGERIQQNRSKLSAKVRVALGVPHEDRMKSVPERDLSR